MKYLLLFLLLTGCKTHSEKLAEAKDLKVLTMNTGCQIGYILAFQDFNHEPTEDDLTYVINRCQSTINGLLTE